VTAHSLKAIGMEKCRGEGGGQKRSRATAALAA
jgi:hypothetical protein